MFRIDNTTVAGTLPAPTPVGTPGYFTDGSAAGGIPATIVSAEFLNMIQEELANAVIGAGLTLSKTSFNQLSTAMAGISPGRLLNVQTFAASGTYTPTPGTKKIRVTVVGAGGGGGGSAAVVAGQGACGVSGGGGGFAVGIFTSGYAGAAVVVGTGGAGNTGNNAGASGGTSSFLTLSATGGGGGTGSASATVPTATGSASGGVGSGGNVHNGNGSSSNPGAVIGTNAVIAGLSGTSLYAGGRANATITTQVNGGPGGAPGAGGAGGVGGGPAGGSAAASGGNGANGEVMIEEFT